MADLLHLIAGGACAATRPGCPRGGWAWCAASSLRTTRGAAARPWLGLYVGGPMPAEGAGAAAARERPILTIIEKE